MRAEDRTRYVVAGLLGAAATIHLVAAYEPEHLENQLFFGFFWVVAVAQAVLALALSRAVRGSAYAALSVNVLLIGLWVVTRIVALPGEEHPEPVEFLGILAKAVEIASLPFLIRILGGLPRIAKARAGSA